MVLYFSLQDSIGAVGVAARDPQAGRKFGRGLEGETFPVSINSSKHIIRNTEQLFCLRHPSIDAGSS